MLEWNIRSSTQSKICNQLGMLKGLPLVAARRAADLRTLQFGALHQVEGGSVGDFALHIQCPWRIDGPDGIVTGRLDLWEPIERGPDFDWDSWDYEKSPNLQDMQFDQMLKRHCSLLVVQAVAADDFGGAEIIFRGGYVLRMFPAGTRRENWRLFQPSKNSPHFVIRGGKIESEDE